MGRRAPRETRMSWTSRWEGGCRAVYCWRRNQDTSVCSDRYAHPHPLSSNLSCAHLPPRDLSANQQQGAYWQHVLAEYRDVCPRVCQPGGVQCNCTCMVSTVSCAASTAKREINGSQFLRTPKGRYSKQAGGTISRQLLAWLSHTLSGHVTLRVPDGGLQEHSSNLHVMVVIVVAADEVHRAALDWCGRQSHVHIRQPPTPAALTIGTTVEGQSICEPEQGPVCL